MISPLNGPHSNYAVGEGPSQIPSSTLYAARTAMSTKRSNSGFHFRCVLKPNESAAVYDAASIPYNRSIIVLAVIAKLKVVAGKESEFERVMLELAKDVRANEPGNKMYTLTKSEAGEYLMLELYEDEAALATHGQTAHFKAAGPKFAGLMAGRPEIQQLKVIG
jgi:quinol monooxygenase YgiN